MKRAFTIVELMMVIAVIAVLMGIITTAASSSIKMARSRKATTLCTMVQAGLAVYHAQKGDWPVTLGNVTGNSEGLEGSSDNDLQVLTASQVRTCVRSLVHEAKAGNPMMDISGLFVSRNSGESNQKSYGLDFTSAVRGTKQSPKKMKVSEMYFGYPEQSHGWFRRFKMVYSIPADSITVSQQ